MNLNNLGELDISYKYHSSLNGRPVIRDVEDAVRIAMKVIDQERVGLQEQFAQFILTDLIR